MGLPAEKRSIPSITIKCSRLAGFFEESVLTPLHRRLLLAVVEEKTPAQFQKPPGLGGQYLVRPVTDVYGGKR